MNHKLKIGLEIGGGLIGLYVLYSLYQNYQANQAAAAQANADALQFLPPLESGGYAPAETSAGTDDSSDQDLNALLTSILNPSSTTSSTTGTGTTSSTGSSTTSSTGSTTTISSGVGTSGSGVNNSPSTGSGSFNRIQPVGPEPVRRIIVQPAAPINVTSSDGVTTSIV